MMRIFDIPLVKPGKGENKIAHSRVHYAIASYDNKIYIHGGMNEENEIVSDIEEFCAMTYKMQILKPRLDTKCPGRRGHAMIAID